jgi:hypothetical protein
MGYIIRRKLHLRTHKSDGVFIIPLTEQGRLRYLFDKYAVDDTSPSAGHQGD